MAQKPALNVEDTQLVKASCRNGHVWWVDPERPDGVQKCWMKIADRQCNLRVWIDLDE